MPYIFNKLMEEAEVKKLELENLQRNDKKLRIEAKERRDNAIDSDNPYAEELMEEKQ